MTIQTAMQTPLDEELFWLPNGCPEWCYGRMIPDYHKADDHPDDRSHMGVALAADLTLEPGSYGGPRSIATYL